MKLYILCDFLTSQNMFSDFVYHTYPGIQNVTYLNSNREELKSNLLDLDSSFKKNGHGCMIKSI